MCGITRLQARDILWLLADLILSSAMSVFCSLHKGSFGGSDLTLKWPLVHTRDVHPTITPRYHVLKRYILVQMKNCSWQYCNIKLIFPHLRAGVGFRVPLMQAIHTNIENVNQNYYHAILNSYYIFQVLLNLQFVEFKYSK